MIVPTLKSMGAHRGLAATVAQGLRVVTRPPRPHWSVDADQACADFHRWVLGLDTDADAVVPVPSHNTSRGPGHTTAELAADALDRPVAELCIRRNPNPSALLGRRLHWSARLDGLDVRPSRSLRVIVADNTITTGHTVTATIAALTRAGHTVAAIVAASHSTT